MIPIAVYPRGYVDKILEDVDKIRHDVKAGLQPTFDNIEDLIASLDGDDE